MTQMWAEGSAEGIKKLIGMKLSNEKILKQKRWKKTQKIYSNKIGVDDFN